MSLKSDQLRGKGAHSDSPSAGDSGRLKMRIQVSDDKSEVLVSIYPEPGQSLSTRDLLNALKQYNVTLAPNPAALAQLRAGLEEARPIKDLVLVKAEAPIPGEDAWVDVEGEWFKPVFPGDSIGTLHPVTHPQPGRLVDGSELPPPPGKEPVEIDVARDGNITLDLTGRMRAEKYGLVRVRDRQIRIDPLLRISADLMTVTTTIHAEDYLGNPITPERIQEAMAVEEIAERLDGGAVARALAEVHETRQPKPNVVICRGIPPQPGKDGWFEMYVKDQRSDVGLETGDGRVDYRARGTVRSVMAREPLGKLIPPEEGRPGRDVFGRIIPAPHGRAFPLRPLEGVETFGAGDEYRSSQSGMVFFINNNLSVTDIYQTEADVDMTTGNIELEKGSVHVRGAVLAGFSVNSPRNIVVEDVIESAHIEAGGDVEVHGGILMDRGGKITAGGGVSALYAKNATIHAEGDVDIHHEIQNCLIYAGRRVLAIRGRGKIIGSTIRCGEGVIANEIGSELGIPTTIFLGHERKSNEEDVKRIKHLKGLIQKIYAVLGSDSPKAILERARPEKRETVAELLKSRFAAEKELLVIEERLAIEREEMRNASNAMIKVKGAIHAGVTIHCFGSHVKLKKTVHQARIFYDANQKKIDIGGL